MLQHILTPETGRINPQLSFNFTPKVSDRPLIPPIKWRNNCQAEPLRGPPPAGPLHVAPTVQGTVDESWCTCEKTTVTTVSTYQVSSSEDKSPWNFKWRG
jgi:hypothetical protein